MSERERWMPSAVRIQGAMAGGWPSVEREIRSAVEKAMAEQEARHKREVLEAKISALMDFRVEIGNETGLDDALAMYLTYIRAELAALEVKP